MYRTILWSDRFLHIWNLPGTSAHRNALHFQTASAAVHMAWHRYQTNSPSLLRFYSFRFRIFHIVCEHDQRVVGAIPLSHLCFLPLFRPAQFLNLQSRHARTNISKRVSVSPSICFWILPSLSLPQASFQIFSRPQSPDTSSQFYCFLPAGTSTCSSLCTSSALHNRLEVFHISSNEGNYAPFFPCGKVCFPQLNTLLYQHPIRLPWQIALPTEFLHIFHLHPPDLEQVTHIFCLCYSHPHRKQAHCELFLYHLS